MNFIGELLLEDCHVRVYSADERGGVFCRPKFFGALTYHLRCDRSGQRSVSFVRDWIREWISQVG
ncbi:MAG: hypothetical protein AAGC80_03055, partial [Rhodococcus sp. (in: high G+C Gram-positive bacteria)]